LRNGFATIDPLSLAVPSPVTMLVRHALVVPMESAHISRPAARLILHSDVTYSPWNRQSTNRVVPLVPRRCSMC
jgi:hypothetical protein